MRTEVLSRQAVLLGNPETKRTVYLRKAAEEAGLPLLFVDWRDWEQWKEDIWKAPETDLFLKIDPPLWNSCSLGELGKLAEDYRSGLSEIGKMADGHRLAFLNHPQAVAALLDKRGCKKRLKEAGLPVTEELKDGGGTSAEMLLERMHREKIYQVFIKPVNGSGAAGVSAFRLDPHRGRMALYTCALLQADGSFVNTKRLRYFSGQKEILLLLDRLLGLDCVVERWYAKAEYEGFSYDLRAVVQDGRMDFLLARLSKGPVTNLHLNNHPMEVSVLGLPETVLEKAAWLCREAMKCFPGLRSAGIDVLLEKGSLQPRLIEMNAQGDLIYQDIYRNNVIYRHQVEMMQGWRNGMDG